MRRSLLALLLLAACDSTEGGQRDVALADLPCASLDPASGVWESAPFPVTATCGDVDAGPTSCCPWIELPGHTAVRVEHGLGAVPRAIGTWISFGEYGVGGTPASGDAVRLESADDTYVVVENHTDQRFRLRLDLR